MINVLQMTVQIQEQVRGAIPNKNIHYYQRSIDLQTVSEVLMCEICLKFVMHAAIHIKIKVCFHIFYFYMHVCR